MSTLGAVKEPLIVEVCPARIPMAPFVPVAVTAMASDIFIGLLSVNAHISIDPPPVEPLALTWAVVVLPDKLLSLKKLMPPLYACKSMSAPSPLTALARILELLWVTVLYRL